MLQAAIALVHASAPSFDETDWKEIVCLYDLLLVAWPSPIVALNRAVAVSQVDGPEVALALVEGLERMPDSLTTTTCRRSRPIFCDDSVARKRRSRRVSGPSS
jgi:predicted RNA polymerase sigma factor